MISQPAGGKGLSQKGVSLKVWMMSQTVWRNPASAPAAWISSDIERHWRRSSPARLQGAFCRRFQRTYKYLCVQQLTSSSWRMHACYHRASNIQQTGYRGFPTGELAHELGGKESWVHFLPLFEEDGRLALGYGGVPYVLMSSWDAGISVGGLDLL